MAFCGWKNWSYHNLHIVYAKHHLTANQDERDCAQEVDCWSRWRSFLCLGWRSGRQRGYDQSQEKKEQRYWKEMVCIRLECLCNMMLGIARLPWIRLWRLFVRLTNESHCPRESIDWCFLDLATISMLFWQQVFIPGEKPLTTETSGHKIGERTLVGGMKTLKKYPSQHWRPMVLGVCPWNWKVCVWKKTQHDSGIMVGSIQPTIIQPTIIQPIERASTDTLQDVQKRESRPFRRYKYQRAEFPQPGFAPVVDDSWSTLLYLS